MAPARSRPMANAAIEELKRKSDAAAANLAKQLQGMEPYLDESDEKPVAVLQSFAVSGLPLIEIKPGHAAVTPERQKMTLGQLREALDTQRRGLLSYLDSL